MGELESSQEEADTRLILHAKHAADTGYQTVIVISEDTDVFVLLLSFAKDIPATLYQKRGTKTRTQFVDISLLRLSLGDELCGALLGFHAYTGCDTVSSFVGRGKTGPLDKMRSNSEFQCAFSNLGSAWEISDQMFDTLQHFTRLMYASSTKTVQVNQLRYEVFFAKRGEIESNLLPPCKDSLTKHALRANYQAGIWKRSLETKSVIPDPEGNGWVKDDSSSIAIDWMAGTPAPEAVLEMMACQCKRVCKKGECGCIDNGLKCTPMCKLQTCENQRNEEDELEMTVDIESDCDDDDDED